MPYNASWLNRTEAQFAGLRSSRSTEERRRAIRRYISWRNHDHHDRRLRKIGDRASVA